MRFFNKAAGLDRHDIINDRDLGAAHVFQTLPELAMEVGEPNINLSHLGSIYERSWFRRTWIIQELVLSTCNPLVLCGSSSISWGSFVRASQYLLFALQES